jgi:hypothetical protein
MTRRLGIRPVSVASASICSSIFATGVVGREGEVGRGGERGERGEDLRLVGGDGGRDERLGLGLLQAERVALAGLVAFVVVDGDFQRLRQAVVSGIAGGELQSLGGTADGARGIDDLEGVLVVETLILAGGGGDDDLGREEIGERGRDVLGEAARVVRERDVEFGRTHES